MSSERAPDTLPARIDALRAIGAYGEARDVAAAAVAADPEDVDGGTAPTLAVALLELGRAESDLGRYGAAGEAWRRSLGCDPEPDAGARMAALGELAALMAFLGDTHEAAAFAAEAARLASTDGDASADDRATALANAAVGAQEAGLGDDAVRWIDAARAALRPEPDTVRGARAAVAVGLAASQLHRAHGRYAEADAELRATLELVQTRLGAASVEAAAVHNDLGVVAKFAGRFEDAEASYTLAIRALERAGGDANPDTAALLHNLAGLAQARGDNVAAEAPARRGVALREQTLGPDHPLVVRDRVALAAILDALGQPAEAAAILDDSIGRLEASLGPDHPEVAVALNNLAAIRGRGGDLEAAATLHERALGIKERAGAGPASVAISLNNLAAVRRRQGRHGDAERDYRRALALLEGSVAADHPAIVAIRTNIRALDRSRLAIVPLQPRPSQRSVSPD